MGKKKNKKLKDRFQVLSLEMGEKDINPATGHAEINLRFDLVNGTQDVFNASTGEVIEPVSMAMGYIGEKKFRTTSEIKTNQNTLCFTQKVNQYKHLVAIDTNSFLYTFKAFNLEVTLSLGMAFVLLDNNRIEPIRHIFATSENSKKPENENWMQLIELLKQNCQCSDPRMVGIVVDSDLGNLADYNSRKLPIFNDYFLPAGYELLYASDKVTDNILNQMIRACHKMATEMIPIYIQHLDKAQE
ncbi:MAG: hypothetical protein B7Y37_08950 [Sphingobacteriia bacterium 28-36-52]|nr:MAG: hypothetical protein B7Y37_08950 [Sphingobacteriia bacterium 28-36-52]